MDANDKRSYIYENIHKLNDHKHLLSIIKSSECKFTENSNGIFLNLNTISDEIIDNIYFLVYSDINTDINTHLYQGEVEIEKIEKEKEIISKVKEIKFINDYKIDSFSEIDKEIINKSKVFKL
jgi:uncharacterized protein with ACT and thioredoxin-like domain